MAEKAHQDEQKSPLRIIIPLSVVLFIVRIFSFDIMQVEGHSMEPTLKSSQIIFVNRLAYGLVLPGTNQYIIRWALPQKDDILVFKQEGYKQLLIKRCAVTQGKQYHFVDGLFYTDNSTKPLATGYSLKLELYDIVPEGHVIVFGDNLDDSIDSRTMGFIPVANIIGKIFKF